MTSLFNLKKIWEWIKNHFSTQTILAVETCILGLSAGLVAVLFQICTDWAFQKTILNIAQKSPLEFAIFSFLSVIGGSLAVGWLLVRIAPEAAGSGIPQVKSSLWKDFGYIPFKVLFVKFFAGVISIGSGVSLGREGPSVQLGSCTSSSLSSLFGRAKQNRREPCVSGAAAGLAAAFNTPLAAITFALEEIINDMNTKILSGVVLASVMGAFVVHALRGPQPAFDLSVLQEPHWTTYLLCPLVAIAASLIGVAFQKSCLMLRKSTKKLTTVPLWCRPAIGGFVVWTIGITIFFSCDHLGVFGLGYQDLSSALKDSLTWKIALALLVAKFIATTFAYGTGGCGGIFAPSLFLGAMCGATFAQIASTVTPLNSSERTILMLVGMSSTLGALVHAPLTSILILFEMTHDFTIVPSLMIATIISQPISKALSKCNFYEAILEQDGIHIEQFTPPRNLKKWHHSPAILAGTFNPITIQNTHPNELRSILLCSPHHKFPVVQNGKAIGLMVRKEIEKALTQNETPHIHPIHWLHPDATIHDAEKLMIQSSDGFICIGNHQTQELIAILTLHDLLRKIQQIDENSL